MEMCHLNCNSKSKELTDISMKHIDGNPYTSIISIRKQFASLTKYVCFTSNLFLHMNILKKTAYIIG
jgi:hypothetical protein